MDEGKIHGKMKEIDQPGDSVQLAGVGDAVVAAGKWVVSNPSISKKLITKYRVFVTEKLFLFLGDGKKPKKEFKMIF
jgi:hypothetical protein